ANQLLKDRGCDPVQVAVGELRVAVMGQYNAGKSTLINALVGAKVADTGNVPVTKQVVDYRQTGYVISDLPGSGAEPEDELKARDALESAHAVLYLVASTQLEHQSVRDDLSWLVERRKAFLLVI